ncbi:MAG: hypothetical protein J6V30_06330 [Paludibacteraceae bacterium]|nr:hypothetical protein [Paludibacteraceae bacterium]
MKRFLLLLLSSFISFSISAQCLGEDCSIKGRNKAARKKAVKMTGNKKLGKIRKVKRQGTAFDPFAAGGSKKASSEGFDPFEAEANSKKRRNKNQGFDPFAKNDKRKGRKINNQGFDPFEAEFASKGTRRSRGKANDSWAKNAGKSKSIISGGFSGWDGEAPKRIRNRRGKANDTWAMNQSHGVRSGGGIWSDGQVNSRSGGGSNRVRRAGISANDNWDQVMSYNADQAPDYERVDNTPKSYSDYEGTSVSSDITYNTPMQYKFSLLCGTLLNTGSTAKNYFSAADPRPILGAEFALEWPTTGSKNYHHYFNIPTIGLAFTYLNLGNEKQLGHTAAVYPYVNIPFVRSPYIDFYFSGGMGLAYVSNYDKSTPENPTITNPLIGSPLNAILRGGIGLAIRPYAEPKNEKEERKAHYTITGELSWIHLNSCSFSQPSKGINALVGQIGFKYNPDDMENIVRQKAEKLPHYFSMDIFVAGGAKELTHLDDTKFGVGNINLAFYFQAANVYRIGLGIDGFFDNSFANKHIACPHFKYQGMYDNHDWRNQVKAGVCLSNEIVFGRITTALDGGWYFYHPINGGWPTEYNKNITEEQFYFRLGLKYRFTDRWFLIGAVKTHGWAIDSGVLGFGYSLLL